MRDEIDKLQTVEVDTADVVLTIENGYVTVEHKENDSSVTYFYYDRYTCKLEATSTPRSCLLTTVTTHTHTHTHDINICDATSVAGNDCHVVLPYLPAATPGVYIGGANTGKVLVASGGAVIGDGNRVYYNGKESIANTRVVENEEKKEEKKKMEKPYMVFTPEDESKKIVVNEWDLTHIIVKERGKIVVGRGLRFQSQPTRLTIGTTGDGHISFNDTNNLVDIRIRVIIKCGVVDFTNIDPVNINSLYVNICNGSLSVVNSRLSIRTLTGIVKNGCLQGRGIYTTTTPRVTVVNGTISGIDTYA